MATTVSILMPVRNAEVFIGAAIGSVLRQSLSEFELIVAINDCTDASETIARQYAESDPRVRVCACPGGLTAALNAAAGVARGTFLARLDADDEMMPQRVETQLELLVQHPDVVLVGSPAVVIDDRSRVIGTLEVPRGDRDLCAQLMRRNPFVHSSVMMRRDAFVRVGGYRDDFPFVEDYDLWLRMAGVGRLQNLPDPLIRYRENPDGVSRRNSRQQNLNRKLCLLGWRRHAALISAAEEKRLAGELIECDARQAELDEALRLLAAGDLALFAGVLPLLGSADARRLARTIQRSGEGCCGRFQSARFRFRALVTSRLAYARTARQGQRRLAALRRAAEMSGASQS